MLRSQAVLEQSCRVGLGLLVALWATLSFAQVSACGGSSTPPKRGVIETDVDSWGFRRYQSVLDIEVWVPKNKAIAYTASYANKSSEKKGRISEKDIVNAFVTRYKKNDGITRALVKFARRLAQESGYQVQERRIDGVRVFEVNGLGEFWLLWAAKNHVVKLGGRGRTSVPSDLLEAYAERYPSRLKAGALEGPLPEGLDEPQVEDEPFDSDDPKPEWK